jgi:BirA family transcriptional regulator, biotin operon repressor / biotin---[acetyl-CoA-carboxylase] ligase
MEHPIDTSPHHEIIRFTIQHHPVVSSTMDLAAAEALRGAPEGCTVVADEQTSGRGRRGRAWTSPPGAGLYLSTVIRPPVEPPPGVMLLPLLTLAAGVGVREGLRAATGLAPDLKWPNDLLVGRRKLAGILAEGLGLGTAAQAVVIGVGINVLTAMFPPGVALLATSLEAELGRPVDRALVLREVLAGWAAAYGDLRAGRADDILRRWRAAAPWAVGTPVEWDAPAGRRTGETAGIDAGGALLVNTDHGVERVIAGEVRWLT